MAFIWTDKLSVGVPLIDDQHRALFKLANEFFEACNQKKGLDQIEVALKHLDNYVLAHFRDEESYMQKIAYPGLAAQKTAHKAFVDKLNAVKAEYASKESGKLLVLLGAIRLVSDWLTNHISVEDKKIGQFAK